MGTISQYEQISTLYDRYKVTCPLNLNKEENNNFYTVAILHPPHTFAEIKLVIVAIIFLDFKLPFCVSLFLILFMGTKNILGIVFPSTLYKLLSFMYFLKEFTG